jgi:type II secretory pathway pseudopilin PulG
MYCAWCGTQVATVSYTPCVRCGNPTNGAQRQAAGAAQGSNTAMVVIAVVVGGLVVVAIIGILAAIAVPNLLTAMQRSKQKRTMADVRSVATAVEAYGTDKGGYPAVGSYDELPPLLSPTYIKQMPKVDGWGKPLRYACTQMEQGRCTHYALGSGGKDMTFERNTLAEYVASPPGGTSDFNCDIVFADGNFVEYPEGVQH